MKADIDELRRLGSTEIQAQLVGEDPRKYINNANQTMVAGTNYTPSNPGNVNTYSIFTITGAFTSITFTNNTQAKSVTLTTTRVAGDVTIVDLLLKTVTINGVQNSNVVTAANWWDIPAGGGQTVKYTVTGGPPTSVVMATKQGWM
jgi:phage-related protein